MPDTAAIELSLKKSQSLDNFYILQCRSDAVLAMSLKLFDTKWKLTIWGVLKQCFQTPRSDRFMHKDSGFTKDKTS